MSFMYFCFTSYFLFLHISRLHAYKMSQTGRTLKLGPNSNDIEVIQIINIITGPVILLGSMMYVGSRSLIH